MNPVLGMDNAFKSLPPGQRSATFVKLEVIAESEVGDTEVRLGRFYAFLEDLLAPIHKCELSDVFVFVAEFWEISKKQLCVSRELETHFLFGLATFETCLIFIFRR